MEVELKTVDIYPTPDITNKTVTKTNQCCSSIKSKLSNQDFTQKIDMVISFVIELYRVLMGTMLVVFVPQNCGEHTCSTLSYMFNNNPSYTANSSINIITLAAFVYLYVVEIKRETTMINYLEVNKSVACDNASVGKALLLLPENKRLTVLSLDYNYQIACYIAMLCFLVNSIYSGISVHRNYLDSKTASVFVTNIVFLAGKLIDANALANTEKNIFYSAYMKERVQYNYVDPDKIDVSNRVTDVTTSETTPALTSV